MAYSELIKNFNRIRDYMRDFYVYGFKRRDEYTGKSARSYDDERRRMESLLGDYMRFRQTQEGKNVFLSIDSRSTRHNPLYAAWKAKSFTDGDITLHFVLLDVLLSAKDGKTLSELMEEIDALLADAMRVFDESTVRKKLKEYVSEGLVRAEKSGKTVRYTLEPLTDVSPYMDVLDFFSEVAPCGVVGSSLLDKTEHTGVIFTFKHHYITGALDSEIAFALLTAMQEKRYVHLLCLNPKKGRETENLVIPLKLLFSTQSGRQYLLGYVSRGRRFYSFRLDYILSVTPKETAENFVFFREKLTEMQKHLWGVATHVSSGARLEHVEFTVCYTAAESHIPRRLEREKRCGTVEHPDETHSRFSADVYDAEEMVPWIRSFICRITDIHFSNAILQQRFLLDLKEMYRMYGMEEEAPDVLQ